MEDILLCKFPAVLNEVCKRFVKSLSEDSFCCRRVHNSLYIQGVPVLVCQTKLGDRDHRSKKILSKDPCPEMNRLASRRM